MKVIAVIVTHNRLHLLKETVEGIRQQRYPAAEVLVINNRSTDGTEDWLQQQQDLVTITQENLGSSYGTYTGIREAYLRGADWVWVMDDDAIPYPDTLQKMMDKIEALGNSESEFGFFSSKVVWTNGLLHNRHEPPLINGEDYQDGEKKISGLKLVRFGTFVSILFSRKAISKAGLPIREFFIWHDDIEYTERILRKGFKGALVDDSLILHKTPDNINHNLFTDDPKAVWKYYYGFRNELYVRRHKKGMGSFYRNVFKRLFYWPFLILSKRKNHRWLYIKTLWKGTWASLHFNPEQEKISTE